VLKEKREINHKRVYRVYTKLGLAVRRKTRKRVAQANRRPRIVPAHANEQWSMDFMSDVLSSGRRLRTLNIVDDATRECLAIEVDTSLSGGRVARVLTEIGQGRPFPKRIVVDNGPEFTSKALDQWAYRNSVELAFIRPGKPVENCFIESFNGKFRDECLNLHWFTSLDDAKRKIDEWRFDYNFYRPHSSLGGKPPAEFAAQSGLGRLRRPPS
jgi:putative transposase